MVDERSEVLRPAIIWCDSRCVDLGEEAAERIGREKCLQRLLNFPGNFTASKLKWVMDEEPKLYRRIHKAMLPGDYIALCMTGEAKTTLSGLSEGILWDFKSETTNHFLGLPPSQIVSMELTKEPFDLVEFFTSRKKPSDSQCTSVIDLPNRKETDGKSL